MISDGVFNNKQYRSEDYLWNSNQEAVDEINIIIKKTIMEYDEYGEYILSVLI